MTIPSPQCTSHGAGMGRGCGLSLCLIRQARWSNWSCQDQLDHLAFCMKDRKCLMFINCLCPSLCWGQRLNSQSHRHFVWVHDVRVPHRQTKAGLLGFSFTKVLKQSAVCGRFSGWNLGLIWDPNFSEKSGHAQRFASLQKVSSNCNWKIRSNKTSGWKWWPTHP